MNTVNMEKSKPSMPASGKIGGLFSRLFYNRDYLLDNKFNRRFWEPFEISYSGRLSNWVLEHYRADTGQSGCRHQNCPAGWNKYRPRKCCSPVYWLYRLLDHIFYRFSDDRLAWEKTWFTRSDCGYCGNNRTVYYLWNAHQNRAGISSC